MSIALFSQVFGLQFRSKTEKLVMLALADAANDDGVTWMAVRSKRAGKMDLCRKASSCERSVQAAIKSLVQQGFLIRHENPGRGVVYIVRTTPANSAGVQLPLGLTPANPAGGPANFAGKPSIKPNQEKQAGAAGEPVDKCSLSGRMLPTGVKAWQWDAYLGMRRALGKPVQVGVAVLLLCKLDAIAANGWYAGDLVEKALINAWTDFHEPSAGRVTGIRRAVAGQPCKPVGATDEDEARLREIEGLANLQERLEARAKFFAAAERRNQADAVGDIVANLPFVVRP